MILYNNHTGASQVLFIFQLRGSVFPFAFCIALPSALLSLLLKVLCLNGMGEDWACSGLLSSDGGTAAWNGFTFLVGFVIVFRTSQAYARFWEALADTHSMLAEWFDAVSSIVAFTRFSQAHERDQMSETFLHTIVRVFSMLSASALQDLSDVGSHQVWGLEVLDPGAIDDVSISTLDGSVCRVELIYSWIQQLVVEKMSEGIVHVPAPIAARIFAELASGMAKYQDARKHARVPFPFPYAQTTMTLLLFHWLLTPLVMIQWSGWASGAAIFTFAQVFTLWSLNAMATQFERPFGGDPNDIDALEMQEMFNKKLVLLMGTRTRRTPKIDPTTFLDIEVLRRRERIHAAALKREGWEIRAVGSGGRKRSLSGDLQTLSRRCARIRRCLKLRVLGLAEENGKPQVAVSTRYSVKRYGIVDGQRTAVLTIGIFKDELAVAMPADMEDEKKDVVEVKNIHGAHCSLTMKRIPIQQRHNLTKAPPPEWEDGDFIDFPATFTFRAEVLVNAYHNLGRRKVELVSVWEEGDEHKADTDSDSSEGVVERLGDLEHHHQPSRRRLSPANPQWADSEKAASSPERVVSSPDSQAARLRQALPPSERESCAGSDAGSPPRVPGAFPDEDSFATSSREASPTRVSPRESASPVPVRTSPRPSWEGTEAVSSQRSRLMAPVIQEVSSARSTSSKTVAPLPHVTSTKSIPRGPSNGVVSPSGGLVARAAGALRLGHFLKDSLGHAAADDVEQPEEVTRSERCGIDQSAGGSANFACGVVPWGADIASLDSEAVVTKLDMSEELRRLECLSGGGTESESRANDEDILSGALDLVPMAPAMDKTKPGPGPNGLQHQLGQGSKVGPGDVADELVLQEALDDIVTMSLGVCSDSRDSLMQRRPEP